MLQKKEREAKLAIWQHPSKRKMPPQKFPVHLAPSSETYPPDSPDSSLVCTQDEVAFHSSPLSCIDVKIKAVFPIFHFLGGVGQGAISLWLIADFLLAQGYDTFCHVSFLASCSSSQNSSLHTVFSMPGEDQSPISTEAVIPGNR